MSDHETTGASIEEVFRLLGNETRMRIMQALWSSFEFSDYVTDDRDGVPFGDLREAAGIDDPGNFNYHLGELVDRLVEAGEDGYVLTPLGYNLMRALDRYTIYQYEPIEEWVVDDPCPFCGGELVAGYRREILEVTCRECGGLASDGNFTFVELASTGVSELSRTALLDVATLTMASRVRTSAMGICWDCHAPMDVDDIVCVDHPPGTEGICPTCDHRFGTRIAVSCPTCGNGGQGPLIEYAIVSPPVEAFFGTVGSAPWEVGPWRYRLAALGSASETVRSTDPLDVRVAFTAQEERTIAVTVAKEASRVSIRDVAHT